MRGRPFAADPKCRRSNSKPKRILLVASPGGHLVELSALQPSWGDLERRWVTHIPPDRTHLLPPELADEDVVFAHGPMSRNVSNLIRNLWLAWRIVREYEPDVILSTGAALAVPFFLVGRVHQLRLIYVESLTRVNGLALSGRLIYPLADVFFVQWDNDVGKRKVLYAGSLG